MHKDLIIVFIFVIIIAIVCIVDTINDAMVIVALMTNFVVLTTLMCKIHRTDKGVSDNVDRDASLDTSNSVDTSSDVDTSSESDRSYTGPMLGDEYTTADEKLVAYVKKRPTEHSITKAQVSKTANYFRPFFTDEFEREERREWMTEYEK